MEVSFSKVRYDCEIPQSTILMIKWNDHERKSSMTIFKMTFWISAMVKKLIDCRRIVSRKSVLLNFTRE